MAPLKFNSKRAHRKDTNFLRLFLIINSSYFCFYYGNKFHLNELSNFWGVLYILLSAKGWTIDEIAVVYEVDRRSVSSWIDAWEASGVEGLRDKPRKGREKILTEEEEELAKKLVEEHLQSLKVALAELMIKWPRDENTFVRTFRG